MNIDTLNKLIKEDVNEIIDNFSTICMNRDLSSNYIEIVNFLEILIQKLNIIKNIKNEDVQENTLQNLNLKEVADLIENLEFKNINSIDEDHHKYIKEIEQYFQKTVIESKFWIKKDELDFYMVSAGLNDAKDILQVSYFLNKNLVYRAYNATTDLDTIIRDGFSHNYWENFINDNNYEDLKKKENAFLIKEKLEAELPNKKETKLKVKV